MSSNLTSSTQVKDDEGNIPNNNNNSIEDRYVRTRCIHHESCTTFLKNGSQRTDKEYTYVEENSEDSDFHDAFGVSDFNDGDCGEPMHSQYLKLDFTPVDGYDDNPNLLKKCSDFWNFINSQPELEGLMVMPEKMCIDVMEPSSSETTLKQFKDISTPALEWLATGVDHKVAFAGKHQMKYCDHRNGDYQDDDDVLPPKNKNTTRLIENARSEVFQVASSRHIKPPVSEKQHCSSPNAVVLCSQLDNWDRQHPKSMDPPGRVPNLTHAVLQRKKTHTR